VRPPLYTRYNTIGANPFVLFSYPANCAVLLGIIIVFYFSISYWHEHADDEEPVERAERFNWHALPEFYGTAVYSFEGIGLILPIQNEMREPERFPRVLAVCMLAILVLFLLLGEIPTIAFGRITSGSMTAVLRDYCEGWLVPAVRFTNQCVLSRVDLMMPFLL
jgi:amino acid permease